MIRSKIDAMKEERLVACNKLEKALATKRGSKEARDEAHERRKLAAETGKCCSCGAVVIDKSDHAHVNARWITETGNCSSCDATIKRMFVFKSKLNSSWPSEKLLSSFLRDYQSIPNPPYALRGNVPREELVALIEELLYITSKLNTEVKQVAARNRSANE